MVNVSTLGYTESVFNVSELDDTGYSRNSGRQGHHAESQIQGTHVKSMPVYAMTMQNTDTMPIFNVATLTD